MRRTYVQSGYADPPMEAPNWLRRMTGPNWTIPLCADRSGVQLSVGIPDNVLEMRIVEGQLVLPAQGGQLGYSLVGIPFRFPTGLPLGPEEAVRHVYQATAPYQQGACGVRAGERRRPWPVAAVRQLAGADRGAGMGVERGDRRNGAAR